MLLGVYPERMGPAWHGRNVTSQPSETARQPSGAGPEPSCLIKDGCNSRLRRYGGGVQPHCKGVWSAPRLTLWR